MGHPPNSSAYRERPHRLPLSASAPCCQRVRVRAFKPTQHTTEAGVSSLSLFIVQASIHSHPTLRPQRGAVPLSG